MSICIITGGKAQAGSPFCGKLAAASRAIVHLQALLPSLDEEQAEALQAQLDEAAAIHGAETFAMLADPEAARAQQQGMLAELEEVEAEAAGELPAPPEPPALPEPADDDAPDGVWRDESGKFTADADADADGEAESFDAAAADDDDDDEADEADPALALACPYCEADAGSPCVTGSGKVKESPHAARLAE